MGKGIGSFLEPGVTKMIMILDTNSNSNHIGLTEFQTYNKSMPQNLNHINHLTYKNYILDTFTRLALYDIYQGLEIRVSCVASG